jgi:hypothetical protein
MKFHLANRLATDVTLSNRVSAVFSNLGHLAAEKAKDYQSRYTFEWGGRI